MALPVDDLRTRLPPLYGQEAEDNPMVYAMFHLPRTCQRWYVLEGSPKGADLIFFGFVAGVQDEFFHFSLAELEAMRGPLGERVERDLSFALGRLTDVVPAPDS